MFNANSSIECYISWLLNWYWQINFAQLLLMFFYFLTLRLMNMTTQRHGNIDKEWSMTKNVMSEKMEDIFLFKLISLSSFIRLIGFWKLWVLFINEIFESCPLINIYFAQSPEFYLLEWTGCQNYRFQILSCSQIGQYTGKWISQMLVSQIFFVQFWFKVNCVTYVFSYNLS